MTAFQGVDIKVFVVGSAALPTGEDDTEPFKSQGADNNVMCFALAFVQDVIGLGPF